MLTPLRHLKIESRSDHYYLSKTVSFSTLMTASPETISTVFEFSYNMTFGNTGEHRDHRSGGTHRRKNGELFINTFQGKIAEYGIYGYFKNKGIDLAPPDIETWDLGQWDDVDLEVSGRKVNIKSTKHYGNLLLLETKDWDLEGRYIPNQPTGSGEYDFFVLCRLRPDGESLMKRLKALYSNSLPMPKNDFKEEILGEPWQLDILGFISRDELVEAICLPLILPQGALLQGRTRMDAENYYVQAGDLHPISELISLLLDSTGHCNIPENTSAGDLKPSVFLGL